MYLKSFPVHNIDLCLLHHQGLLWQCQACLLSDGTSARPNPVSTLLYEIISQRLCCHLIHLIWMRLTRTSVTPLRKQPKKTIPCGYQNNYIPCWDAECESLYKTFLQSPQGDDSSLAATALLAKLDRKRRDRWSEAVWSIDFSHSSQKAWSILNNLTGRSRYSLCHCPVSADAIASQQVRNGKYEAVDHKSSQLVYQKVYDFWRAITPDAVNISDNFSQREFTAAL